MAAQGLFIFIAILHAASSSVIPRPDGQYAVASSTNLLIDTTRTDPYGLKMGIEQHRQVMTTMYYPVGAAKECLNFTTPYMPPKTAAFYDAQYSAVGLPNNTFAHLEMTHCDARILVHHPHSAFPMVFFSPGLGNSRLTYGLIAQSLASTGHIVITIDHTYDAAIVEFPDGTLALAANITTDSQIEFDLHVRVQDVSFVREQYTLGIPGISGSVTSLFRRSVTRYKFAIAAGHSLGGATAASVLAQDSRFGAAINLDGTFFGSVPANGVKCPLLIVAHDGKNLSSDSSWASTWNATRDATVAAVQFANTTHGSFEDFSLLAEYAGLPPAVERGLKVLIGNLPARTMELLLNGFIGKFVRYSLGERTHPLFSGRDTAGVVKILNQTEHGRCTERRDHSTRTFNRSLL